MKYIEKTEIEKKREDFILKENTLIQRTVYMFTKQQQDMLAYILSEVRPHDPKDKEYLFNATDFIHVASKNDLSGYTYQHLHFLILLLKFLLLQLDYVKALHLKQESKMES